MVSVAPTVEITAEPSSRDPPIAFAPAADGKTTQRTPAQGGPLRRSTQATFDEHYGGWNTICEKVQSDTGTEREGLRPSSNIRCRYDHPIGWSARGLEAILGRPVLMAMLNPRTADYHLGHLLTKPF